MVLAGLTMTAMPSSAIAVPAQLSCFLVLQLAGCHTDGERAVHRAGHAGGGVRGLEVDGGVRVDRLVSLDQLLHDRRNRGGAADCDLAGGAVGYEGLCCVVDCDVLVVGDNGLTFLGEDEADEILGYAGRLALGCDVERTGQLVGACLYVVYGRLSAVYLDSLYGIVQSAEGDVADGLLVACNAGQHDIGLVCDFRVCGGIVDLFAVSGLFLDAGQLDERAARARAVLTGDDRDRAGNAAVRAVRSLRVGGGCVAPQPARAPVSMSAARSRDTLFFMIVFSFVIRSLFVHFFSTVTAYKSCVKSKRGAL